MGRMLRTCSQWRRASKSALTYSGVHVAHGTEDGSYEVLIDRRKLRVPATGEVLQIPSRDIAELVALEWAGQAERDLSKIKNYTLYMTQLCYMKHDTTNTKPKDEIVDHLLKYLSTDSVMFRSPYTNDESLDGSPGIKLKHMQDEQWGPVQRWFESRFKTEQMCLAMKSIMLSLMVIERKIPVEEALRLSRLENDYQKEIWGTVEWHHTVEEMDLTAKIASQALFIQFSTEDIDGDPKLISDF